MEGIRLFFLIFARDSKFVAKKMKELDRLHVPYRIVCGESINHPKIIYRAPRGKYDAINFGVKLIPEDANVVVMNDVDTSIHNFQAAVRCFRDNDPAILFTTEMVRNGPQSMFFRIFNPIRRRLLLAASGDLMLMKRSLLQRIVPLKPCKAEDTYMLFKALELGQKVIFSEVCFAETQRTKTADQEEAYKRRTVAGIYQALSYARPPFLIRLFYMALPFTSPLLLILGRKGYYWARGILLGLLDYLRGDLSGLWESTYTD